MHAVLVDLLQAWKADQTREGLRLSFPIPQGARGFTPYGFVRKNDSAADFVDWYGLSLTLKQTAAAGDLDRVCVTAFFADAEPLKVTLPILFRDAAACLEVPFSAFPLETAKGNRWEFVTGFQFAPMGGNWTVEACVARRRPGIWLHVPVKGKSGEPGERITYRGAVYNCASEPAVVTARQVSEGWESLIAQIRLGDGDSGEPVILAPGASVPVAVSVEVHDNMVPGGHENTVIRVRGQGGRTVSQDSVTLKTLRRLPHPYLFHTAQCWRKVRENIDRYGPYKEPWEEYRRCADAWEVTDPMENRPFCYETKVETGVMSTAYAFAVTGETKYARKLADFYRRFSDPVNGYPARKRGCSQSYVQEGHFFQHLAVGYDMIYDSGVLTDDDKAAMERCFRLYMRMLDVHILDGHISNWVLSELHGALFCALALQDMDLALRFTFGPGGIVQQFRCGMFSDGWWHECSVGYNTWVSSIMLHVAHALLPFGYNLLHTYFPIPFNREVSSTYLGKTPEIHSGMYNQKWGGNRKGYVCIQDMFDAPLPFLDDRGVLFGIADSDEKRLSGIHFGATYDLAYQYYRDPAYLSVIGRNQPDPIFGNPEVHAQALREDCANSRGMGNARADNIGLAMLRSQKPGRPQREQIQAVLRYGSHGNAHGHFDIGELLSVMRYGRSFYNPENCWWGYAHFMYKFYVQCSLTKNMVVVDEKMQVPADSRLILWHSDGALQAAGVEVRTAWCYPPYGGMVYYQDGQTATKEDLRRRCKRNNCYLPIVEGAGSPGYGELTGFTEPILQKRIMAVTDDYIVLFDYLEGEREHQFDSLMQLKGFLGLEGGSVKWTHHTEQMNANPISDAQFITDCSWYQVTGGSVARFRTVFTQAHAGERKHCDRSNYNEPGILNMDVHTAWPRETEQMIGRVAIYDGWAADGDGYTIPLEYRLEVDGKVVDSGEFDGWILGRGELSADVGGASRAVLSLRQGTSQNELGDPVTTPQGVFWGEICLELEDGTVLNLGKCLREPDDPHHDLLLGCISLDNVDTGCGIGRDYHGGRVTIVGTEYPYSLGASPIDHDRAGTFALDIRKLEQGLSQKVSKLTACVGVDAFPGDEWQKRKTYAVRSRGRIGRYITVVEPYEADAVIDSVYADSPDRVRVTLKDGTCQELTLADVEKEAPRLLWKELGAPTNQEGESI